MQNALNNHGVSALFYACMIGDGSSVSLLVKQGARVNLHRAGDAPAEDHAVQLRRALAALPQQPGADIGVQLADEVKLALSPVQVASIQGHFRVVLFLVQNKADVSMPVRP